MRRYSDPLTLVVGVYDDRRSRVAEAIEPDSLKGGRTQLLEDFLGGQIDTVLLALPTATEERLRELVAILEQVSVEVRLLPPPSWYRMGGGSVRSISAIPTIALWERPMGQTGLFMKWLMDKAVAILGLGVLGLPLMVFALVIKVDSPGPVMFRQRRFGFNNRPVEVLKFRTMHVEGQDESGAVRTVRQDPRVTRVGRFLRRMSIDELPQLTNVVRGEMSLVGPRPHAIAMRVGDQYYFQAVRGYAARHRVKPGITGWAQVNGCRGEVDTVEKARRRVDLDPDYLSDWSIWLDVRILVKTIVAAFSYSDVY